MPQSATFRLLLLEDDLSDSELLERHLRKAGLLFELLRVETLESFNTALREFAPDIIISDFSMPHFTAIDALEVLETSEMSIPFILVTGTQADENAVKCLRLGATDYLLKSSLHRLEPAVVNALQKWEHAKQIRQNQQQFEFFMENMPCLGYIKDSQGKYLYTNQRMHDAFNLYGESQLKEALDVRQLDTELGMVVDDALVISTMQPHEASIQTQFDAKDQYWRSFKFPLPREGQETVVGGVALDVTAQALITKELIESNERYRLIFKATESALWDYDLVAQTVTWNEALTDYFGYNPSAIQRSFTWFLDCIHADDVDRIREELALMIAGGGSRWETEFRFRKANGDHLTFSSHAYIMRDAGGKAIRVVASMSNISQRKEWENGLIQARDRAEEMSRMKTNFLANMSHEMRTPMTSILGFTELLREDATGEMAEMLQCVEMSSRRLLETMDSLLDMARLDSADATPVCEEVDVNAEIEAIVDRFSHAVASKDLALVFRSELPQLNALLEKDSFRRILIHLIGNAMKFTETGSITVVVSSSVGADFEPSFSVAITDTGIGIEESILPSVFEGFKQESEGYGRKFEGSGIGLTLAKRLVEAMHGRLAVRSQKAVGSTFTVTLPIGIASKKAIADPPTEPDVSLELDSVSRASIASSAPERLLIPSAAPERSVIGQSPLESRKHDGTLHQILVVEDSDDIVTMVRYFLKKSANVVHASSGEQALELARSGVGDLILMDFNLGIGIDGLETTRRIRAIGLDNQPPIIAMTAYNTLTDQKNAMEAGCSDFISKPFTKRDLLKTISKILVEA